MPDLSLASEYACWFVNRRAHTRQSDRPHPESGRHYYYRPPGERALSADDIRRHLAGEITVGLYAIHPQTQRVKWMAIDADYKRSLHDLLIKPSIRTAAGWHPGALEQSRRGGWGFEVSRAMSRRLPAAKTATDLRHESLTCWVGWCRVTSLIYNGAEGPDDQELS